MDKLPVDCLISIFEKLEVKDMVAGVPLVCKSWYEASLGPSCWRRADLHWLPVEHIDNSGKLSLSRLLEFIVNRSRGSLAEIVFPFWAFSAANHLAFLSRECPRLKSLVLPLSVASLSGISPEHIRGWPNLEKLHLGSSPQCLEKILTEISRHCNNFRELRITGSLRKTDIQAICAHTPRIKTLNLSDSHLPRNALKLLLRGCNELEVLDISNSFGSPQALDEATAERLMRLKSFCCKGSDFAVNYELLLMRIRADEFEGKVNRMATRLDELREEQERFSYRIELLLLKVQRFGQSR